MLTWAAAVATTVHCIMRSSDGFFRLIDVGPLVGVGSMLGHLIFSLNCVCFNPRPTRKNIIFMRGQHAKEVSISRVFIFHIR